MSFAIIDQNCSYIDIEPIKKLLQKEKVTICEQQGGQELHKLIPPKNTVGIYLSHISDVALKHQCDLIRNTKRVTQWLIVIVDSQNSSSTVRKVAVSEFRQKLAKSGKDIRIICDDTKNISEQLLKELDMLKWLQSNIVLITSAKKHVGRKTTANLLSDIHPEYHFEVCDLKDLPHKKEYARRIIIVGTSPDDFAVPGIKSVQHKLTLIYNKIDRAPIKIILARNEKKAVIHAMNKQNWDIPFEFSQFYMCSMEYEKMYRDLNSSHSDLDELRLNREFVMWDKYGLPCTEEEYNSENINSFLAEISVVDRILK